MKEHLCSEANKGLAELSLNVTTLPFYTPVRSWSVRLNIGMVYEIRDLGGNSVMYMHSVRVCGQGYTIFKTTPLIVLSMERLYPTCIWSVFKSAAMMICSPSLTYYLIGFCMVCRKKVHVKPTLVTQLNKDTSSDQFWLIIFDKLKWSNVHNSYATTIAYMWQYASQHKSQTWSKRW